MCASAFFICACLRSFRRAIVFLCAYVFLCARLFFRVSDDAYARMCVCLYVCVCVCVCVCVGVFVCSSALRLGFVQTDHTLMRYLADHTHRNLVLID